MKKKWILVLDSGSGGLWTLNRIKRILPSEHYLFFMDKLHCPYGNKMPLFLKYISYKNIKKILNCFDIKLIVLACNTLSTVCFNFLQNRIKIPIIKIEPFVKKLAKTKQNTLIIATKNTILHNKLLKKLKIKKNIYMFGFPNLAKKIDSVGKNFDILIPELKSNLAQYQSVGIKNIVLGCTHFNYIRNQLLSIFPNVKFFENSDFVAQQVLSYLHKNKMLSKSNSIGEIFTIYKI